MTINAVITEMEQIKAAIKQNNAANRELRVRLHETEEHIKKYLMSKQQDGLKYKGKIITLEKVERYPAKKKKQRSEDAIALIESMGISDAAELYEKIQAAHKDEPVDLERVRIKKDKVKK